MAGHYYGVPVNWVSVGNCVANGAITELQRRIQAEDWGKAIQPFVNHTVYFPTEAGLCWAHELGYVRALHEEYPFEDEVLDLLGRILCQALEVPRDCERKLQHNQHHNFFFFTNRRVLQVYCCHNNAENEAVETLINADCDFHKSPKSDGLEDLPYHECIEPIILKARPYIVSEIIFPDGIDMEALSPRDANAYMRKPEAQKPKAPALKQSQKEKDHPPPPPSDVHEPPSSDRPNGAIYRTGQLLGKGGFAICYDGRLAGTKQVYALKIVKSHMPQKKMEQKFQTELQIHSKMNHPNIVRFQRAFSFQKCTYIVLELCPNGSLMDMVKRRKFITEPEVRFWTVQMAGAIKYMHSKGIIHRDLKMGNIFLDERMNVKVGDFGLAALLMSGKDWSNCRRTTLCGTPNYIAPEILSKDKQGHDHAVDIWSLGIIIFAMLTGKPPFQSTTQDEIYRRARALEYDWPKLNNSENYISEETKDLVAMLLQTPERRPDPDTIVQHPFFTCGWMPQSEEMTPDLREKAPASDKFLSIGVRAGRANLYLRNLKKLCINCEVGPWNSSQKRHTSTYREVTAEEKAGLTPAVPLPEGVVYRPFDEWLREQAQKVMEHKDNTEDAAEALNEIPERVREPGLDDPSLSLPIRSVPQSFAAQQRARPAAGAQTTRARKPRQPSAETSSRSVSESSRSRNVASRHEDKMAGVEDRLAADLASQLKKAEEERKLAEVDTVTLSIKKQVSLFNPREQLEALPNSKPDNILAGLRRLQTELERALNSRSIALESGSPPSHPTIVVKWVDYTNRFGLGYILSTGSVGCIFRAMPVDSEDRSKGDLPPSCVVVRDAERHLQNRGNPAYADRQQLVPISGPNIEFYENNGESGISRGKVNPQNYKITIGKEGEVGRLSRGVDQWDDRKREKIVLWKKFANYMTAYGRDHDYPFDDAVARKPNETNSEAVAAGNVVTFYQRWGDVGCWGFGDGHFQFNFPDHTKIVISADGTWCNFYHLPLEAARDLSVKGSLPPSALDDRQHLSYPVQTLLNFMNKPVRTVKSTTKRRPEIDPMISGIPQANDFRRKIEFIRLAVKEWVMNGGLGNSNMEPGKRLRWYGCREQINVKVPYKHVWVTVGARGGDDRRVAWFDPRKPNDIVPDIE
ncbi:Serine kinase [Venustampulla echinocandica]|uniref:Serine/threonine-protein kinase ATG1 n=1 Tax=Venustampulla echinocandica TaxID=2656787 RepID=A0A370TMP1_9HELO|nr:Serine kinase [Venustampulla echinocandica]RDL36796.1 Serine kinase [Venustampulla echinocandica]